MVMQRAGVKDPMRGLAQLMCPVDRSPEPHERVLSALSDTDLGPNRDSLRLVECMRGLLELHEWSFVHKRPLQILNLACGRAPETSALIGLMSEYADDIWYTGSDVRESALDVAGRRGRGLLRVFADLYGVSSSRLQVRYLVGDLSDRDTRRALPCNQDLIVIRHQNIGFSVPVWTGVFELALSVLSPGGVLVMSSHFDHEHALALSVMRALGATCVGVECMPDPRVIGPGGKAVDRYVAMFQRDDGVSVGD